MRSDINAATPNQPKAWLNWVLLDERLEIVPEGSGGIHVGNPDAIRTLAQTGITVPKNGYLYVYVSNEMERSGIHERQNKNYNAVHKQNCGRCSLMTSG